MHCLVVTIFYCVDNHFVAILLLLIMAYNEFYYIICAIHVKNSLLCISDWLLVSASMNIRYRKMEKFDIGTLLIIMGLYKKLDVFQYSVNLQFSSHTVWQQKT